MGGVEQRLRSLMDLTGPVALAAGVGVVGGGLLRGRPMDELVSSGVSLAVASVPEGCHYWRLPLSWRRHNVWLNATHGCATVAQLKRSGA